MLFILTARILKSNLENTLCRPQSRAIQQCYTRTFRVGVVLHWCEPQYKTLKTLLQFFSQSIPFISRRVIQPVGHWC